MMKRFLLSAFALFSSPAFSQQGDGTPVSPNVFVQVHIDEQAACPPIEDERGNIVSITPQKLCGDYEVSELFKKESEPTIRNAHSACLKFYSNALRLQNIFCSYTKDEQLYRNELNQRALHASQAESIGQVKESQNIVAGMNRVTAGLNHKYMERIAKVSKEFIDSYTNYLQAIGKLNGAAETDTLREATCLGLPRATNLDLQSDAPGHLRGILATTSHATAYSTYSYVMGLCRRNYAELKIGRAHV